MIEKTGLQKIKDWLDQEIVRLTKEGGSIANTKYMREAALHKKHAYQEVKSELKNLFFNVDSEK